MIRRQVRHLAAWTLLAFGSLAAAACGSSSSKNVTGPSTDARCGLAVSAVGAPLEAGGGSGTVTITLNRECTWTARAETEWITFPQAQTGQGSASLAFAVAANPQVLVRRSAIVVNEHRVEVTQTGAPCVFTLGTSSRTVDADGEQYTVPVSSQNGCGWTAESRVPWAAVTPASGSGSSAVLIEVAANGGGARSGTVMIAGVAHTIFQARGDGPPAPGPGPGAPGCTYDLSLGVQPLPPGGGDGAVDVLTAAGCAWTALSDVPWVRVAGSGTGSGPGTVRYAADANNSASPRIGSIAVQGRMLTITQPGTDAPVPPDPEPPPPSPCTFAVSPLDVPLGAAGLTVTVTITASAASCAWTARSDASWIAVSALAGTGAGDLRLTVSANSSTAPRSATVTVGGQAVRITQAGAAEPPAPCTIDVAPLTVNMAAEGATVALAVTASSPSCAWTASSPVPWAVAVTRTGTGSGEARFAVAANPDPGVRTAMLAVGGRTVALSQQGTPAQPPCAYSIAPASQAAAAGGGSGSVAVSASAPACSWTAASSADWLTLTSGASGTGSGQVAFTAAANTTGSARSATITAAGQTATITQASAPVCAYVLSRTSISVAAINLTELVRVEAAAGCAWTAESQVPWIVLTQGATGNGAGDVRFTVALNVALTSRTGTLLIAGQTVTVTQAGLLGTQP